MTVLPLKCIEYAGLFPVNREVAILFVGYNPRMAPFFLLKSLFVLLHSDGDAPGGLANVGSRRVTRACEPIHSFLVHRVNFCFDGAGKGVLKFGTGFESEVEAGVLGDAFQLFGDPRYEREADEGFFLLSLIS